MSPQNEWERDRNLGARNRGNHPSSYTMHDPDFVFETLKLKAGEFFLDLGCGSGDYALHAAQIVGNSGAVFALDKWTYIIDDLITEADSQGLANLKATVCDFTGQVPIEDNCIDVCFMATVLHTLNLDKDANTLWKEVHRVLKPGGRLAIINCKKEDQPFGPPIRIRLAPEEVEDSVTQYGFKMMDLVDLGYNYLIQFGTT